jgi:hypothetical protein
MQNPNQNPVPFPWINRFNLQPGVYIDREQPAVQIVLCDIITHFYCKLTNTVEETDPLVVTRELEFTIDNHNRAIYPIEVFKQKFIKEK